LASHLLPEIIDQELKIEYLYCMKRIVFALCLLMSAASFALAQDASTASKTQEVAAIIDQHTPILEEFAEKLGEHKTHLDERIIVLKYHKTNKEVQEASRSVVTNTETYYNSVVLKVQQFESQWFDQTRNIIAIYTKYGELREAKGGNSNELQDFVDKHMHYLDLLENIKSDLIGVYTDLTTIKNAI
jgi:thiol-disulfide isomerase/thioredoxin